MPRSPGTTGWSSAPDLSDSRADSPGLWAHACHPLLCLAGLCGWPGAASGKQGLNSQGSLPHEPCLSPWFSQSCLTHGQQLGLAA